MSENRGGVEWAERTPGAFGRGMPRERRLSLHSTLLHGVVRPNYSIDAAANIQEDVAGEQEKLGVPCCRLYVACSY